MFQSPEEARNHYKPDRVKVLFVGESPPAAGTFFYYANSNLYRCVHTAFSRVYGAKCGDGDHFLSFFKSVGCYLDDLCLVPVNAMDAEERQRHRDAGMVSLAERIKVMQPEAVIIVMKEIENEVRLAMSSSQWSPRIVRVTTFPVHSERNREACVSQMVEALRVLIRTKIVEG